MALLAVVGFLSAPTATPTPVSTSPPTATSTPANIALSVPGGPAGTKVTVTGSGLLPRSSGPIFLDSPDRSLGIAVTDGSGSFRQDVTVQDGTAAGTHLICVQILQAPLCALFTVVAQTVTPTSTPEPTHTAAPGPIPTASLGPALSVTTPSPSASSELTATPAVAASPQSITLQSNEGFLLPGGLFLAALLLAAVSAAFLRLRMRRQPFSGSSGGVRSERASLLTALHSSSLTSDIPRILLCYRRGDSVEHTDRLQAQLASRFEPGQVIMDIETIEPGLDFTDVVGMAVDASAAVVAVIGPKWLVAADERGDRLLDQPEDHVRQQLSAALERSRRVIPVLLQGAHMPSASELPDSLQPLAGRSSIELNDAQWDSKLDKLTKALEYAVAQTPPPSESADQPQRAASAARTSPISAQAAAGDGSAGVSDGSSTKRRRSLADALPWIGAATAVATASIGLYTFVTRPDPEVATYQKQVITACNQVQVTLSRDHGSEILNLGPPQGFTVRKAGLIQVLTGNLAEVRAELALLDQIKTPTALRDKKSQALIAQNAWYAVLQSDIQFVQATVRDGESLNDLNSQYASRATADAEATARLSSAMSQLANGECRLTVSRASGGTP